jgi:hypothetical protein
MPGTALTPLFKQGAFDADAMNAVNAALVNIVANTPGIVATSVNTAASATAFAAITLLPSTAAAGTYRVTVYGVITTTITTATSWLFTLGWTDDKQAQTSTLATSSTMTAGAFEQGSNLIRSAGTAAITITPTAASAGAGVVAFSVLVERVI